MEHSIRQYLGKPVRLGKRLLCYEELDSTNTRAKELALAGAEDGTVVIANGQTAGRGRMDRAFQSPGGKGLYLTVLLRPKAPVERLACVTALAGVAVCGAVEAVCGIRPGLKWPNDPVLGGRKLCGILTELVLMPDGSPAVALGIGINVLQTPEDFSPELRTIATSLLQELERPVSRERLAAELLRWLEPAYDALERGVWPDWTEQYRTDCVHLGRPVRLVGPNGQETVMALDIDETFGLVVEGADGRLRTVRSGELSVRGLLGYAD